MIVKQNQYSCRSGRYSRTQWETIIKYIEYKNDGEKDNVSTIRGVVYDIYKYLPSFKNNNIIWIQRIDTIGDITLENVVDSLKRFVVSTKNAIILTTSDVLLNPKNYTNMNDTEQSIVRNIQLLIDAGFDRVNFTAAIRTYEGNYFLHTKNDDTAKAFLEMAKTGKIIKA